MSCCPPGSTGYLAADGPTTGAVAATNGVEFYKSGTADSGNCVILIPDVWGWHGGRVRQLADHWASNCNALAVVPKIQPPLEGGTDGDALPPEFDMKTRGADFKAWATSEPMTFATIAPKMQALITHLTTECGIKKMSLVGFCWGYWCVVKMFGVPGLCDQVVSTAGPHPSVTLEDGFFSGNSAECAAKVTVPSLLLPTSNDGDTYREGGAVLSAIQTASNNSSAFSDYPTVVHGFLTRGDDKDENIKAEIQRAEGEITSWINKHF